MSDLLSALTLLTVFHFPQRGSQPSARALSFYPLVGLLLGVLLGAAFLLLKLLFANLVVGALVVALWAILTGGLHLDGFADACDGLFAAATRERRLEILHDVHLGAFGVAGLILLLVVKCAATATLVSVVPLLLAPILGRWAMVYAAAYPLARSGGMAATFRAGLTWREILAASLLAVLISVPFGSFGLVALVASGLVATAIARLALARLGGLTGDIYGMTGESVELTVLLVGAAMLGAK